MTLSERILNLRKQNGLSQEAFAEKLGVSRQSVSKWESGTAIPEIDKIIAMSELFGVSTDELLKGEDVELTEEKTVLMAEETDETFQDTFDITPPIPEETGAQFVQPPQPVQNIPQYAPAMPVMPPQKPKSKKKLIIAIVAIVVAVCIVLTSVLVVVPYFVLNNKKDPDIVELTEEAPIDYPFVLVHGLGGYGEDDETSEIAPYWGAENGSLVEYLEGEGYEVYAPSVGPISSAWDRACELYAQLTGTTVDYGEAHSREHNHERYGRTYEEPLFENWGGERDGHKLKVNLVGHSFGGPTIRLLTALLEYGSEAEVELSGDDVSPLFEGGKGNWVFSVTALCAPHNGSSLAPIADSYIGLIGIDNAAQYISTLAFDIVGSGSSENGAYDLMLDHFHLEETEGEEQTETIVSFISMGSDHAIYDLAPDGAAELNEIAKTVDNVYYFSYAYSTTEPAAMETHIPISSTMPILSPFATLMGSYSGTTEGGIVIDESWRENDGLVNVVSAKYPFGQDYTDLPEEYEDIEKGIWNVAPVGVGDHGRVIGMGATADELHTFFTGLIEMINSL